MILALLASVIALTADQPAPEIAVNVNSSWDVQATAQAHPVSIDLGVIYPDGFAAALASCPETNVCSVGVTFAGCGLFQFPGVIQYGFQDPSGSGPFVTGVNAVVIVSGCDVFADGFEDGTTGAWS